MKLKLPLIAAFVAITSLTACGGGSDTTPTVPVASPATLTFTDNVVGTGTVAAAPLNATVYYTGWLYSETATGKKGTQFDSLTTGPGFTFKLGAGKVISGFEEGVIGMKVGGKRTVMIPSNKGYGAAGTNGIPPNSGLVFDIELRAAVP
jgi:FKBP-type peptidyl-prolyl cis-trans isomerase FkpA